jgi:hypothetical protein
MGESRQSFSKRCDSNEQPSIWQRGHHSPAESNGNIGSGRMVDNSDANAPVLGYV